MDRDKREYTDNDRHLFRLGELDDYKVASDDPDVRGWEIVDKDKQKFGTIRELIVDPNQEKVRYLDVSPTGDMIEAKRDEHILIPIGIAKIDGDDNRVIVNEVDKEILTAYPVYSGEVITRDYEHDVAGRFNRTDVDTTVAPDRTVAADFYNNSLYDEDRFYENRNRRL